MIVLPARADKTGFADFGSALALGVGLVAVGIFVAALLSTLNSPTRQSIDVTQTAVVDQLARP